MYAELSLDHKVLKDVVEKKAVKPMVRRQLVDYARETHQIRVRRACRVIGSLQLPTPFVS